MRGFLLTLVLLILISPDSFNEIFDVVKNNFAAVVIGYGFALWRDSRESNALKANNQLLRDEITRLVKTKSQEELSEAIQEIDKSIYLSGAELEAQANELISRMNFILTAYKGKQDWGKISHLYHSNEPNGVKNAVQIRDAILKKIEEQGSAKNFLERTFKKIAVAFRPKQELLPKNLYSSPKSFEDLEKIIGELEDLLSKLES